MPVNLDKPQRWNEDVRRSVDLYNAGFMDFAPLTYRQTRKRATEAVEAAFLRTAGPRDLRPRVLREHPQVLPMLRMATAPPLARDRLVGLASVSKTLVERMESAAQPQLPRSLTGAQLEEQLTRIGAVIARLADAGILPWLVEERTPTDTERHRAATIIADRLCGAQADPLIRNAQEAWQLNQIESWLTSRGYTRAAGVRFADLRPGTFTFRLNAEEQLESGAIKHIPVDVVIVPHHAQPGELPLLIEAKSAGDYTNTNKRRKEEADKVANLRRRYGPDVRFILFLRGYFDSGYLGYEAAAGIDWVWEHRIDDLVEFGV